MANSKIMNGKETEYEDHTGGASLVDASDLSDILKNMPNPNATEYEKVEGLNLNLKNPDAEASNKNTIEAGLGDPFSEPGFAMVEVQTEADEEQLLDAIYGSYPELLDDQRMEVIIGADDRIRIHATNKYPWSAICALRITAANGKRYIGTGWLVSARTVITAGHCIYLHNEGGWAKSVEVIPGKNDAAEPFSKASSNVLRSVTGWTQGKKRENDYGAIIMPANARLGDKTGTFGFAIRNDAFLSAAALNLSGYPGDKGGSQQCFMAQKPKSVSARVLTYNIDTMGGQSGSPVWVLQDGKRYGVGIHTNGHSTGNSATRIESEVFANLQNWKNLGL